MEDGRPVIDALVSLTGFSLVGGPAYNDARAAEEMLAKLDVPYIAAHPAELQTLEQWGASERGLMPVESTIMVAIPELDGATGPIVFGGRSDNSGRPCTGCHRGCVFAAGTMDRDMHSCIERSGMLAARVDKLVTLRRTRLAERRIAVVLFNFPPNSGSAGTAAYLAVFDSLHRTLAAMKAEGYAVDLPASADELRDRIIEGNRARFGALANVHVRVPADEMVRRDPWLNEIEAQWGPAPGKHQSDGASVFVLGAQFGNVFVGVQPAFGYEGDPMRLLFEKGFAPTHAFSAFYRWLREDFQAHAVLHFGTHGALEFMPGKQAGMSAKDWPDRLIGDLPSLYLYAANNPSEGALAKRRASATLISYLTPPIAHAGLYRGLLDLKASIDRWRGLDPDAELERGDLAMLIQAQAALVELAEAEPAWTDDADARIQRIGAQVLELEYTLIPHGLHVVGATPSAEQRVEMMEAVADAAHGVRPDRAALAAIVGGATPEEALGVSGLEAGDQSLGVLRNLAETDRWLAEDHEISAILKALDGRFIRPAPAGDLLRTPAILPTGRNLHGFDPFRIPSAFAVQDGARQAERIIARHRADGLPMPETVAIVLWGTDNLKNEGAPIGQVLALMGVRPRFDGYGRLAGATLIPLEELGRPRIDVDQHAVGHLPRPAAASDQAAGGGVLPGGIGGRAVRTELRPEACASVHRGKRRRSGNGVAPRLRQCGRRLWIERQPSDRVRRLGRRKRAGGDLLQAQELRLWAAGPAGPADGAAEERSGRCRSGVPELGQRRTGRDHGRSLLRHARRHQPGGQGREGRGVGADLYRRPDARRRRRPDAGGTGGAGNPHADAEPQVVRGHAEPRL